MNLRKILISLMFILSFALLVIVLIKLSLESDFAKVSTKKLHGDDSGYKMKTKYYKEFYYSTGFKRNPSNENMVSLGHFTVNINDNMRHSKLLVKVSIEAEDDAIDEIMKRQSVIRNDVIDSILDIKSSGVDQERLSIEIKKNLNKRLKGDVVKNVYFEKFIVQ